jgi:hypothetical protein
MAAWLGHTGSSRRELCGAARLPQQDLRMRCRGIAQAGGCGAIQLHSVQLTRTGHACRKPRRCAGLYQLPTKQATSRCLVIARQGRSAFGADVPQTQTNTCTHLTGETRMWPSVWRAATHTHGAAASTPELPGWRQRKRGSTVGTHQHTQTHTHTHTHIQRGDCGAQRATAAARSLAAKLPGSTSDRCSKLSGCVCGR